MSEPFRSAPTCDPSPHVQALTPNPSPVQSFLAQAAARPTSLEHPQTSSRKEKRTPDAYGEPLNPDFCPFPHTGWHNTRKRVAAAMIEADIPPAKYHRFLGCGEDVWVYQHNGTGELAFRHNCCLDRWCLVCGRMRSAKIAESLREKIDEELPLFITLTVRGKSHQSLKELLSQLKTSWAALKSSPLWKSKIQGGAAMIEVKWSDSGHWHPHLHILCHGKYLPVGPLTQLWQALTGNSHIVYVTRVTDINVPLAYVTKYASKPMDKSFVRIPGKLAEAMIALKGVRLCACFGTWYGTPLNQEAEDETSPIFTSWSCIGSRRTLLAEAASGSKKARDILAAMERHYARRARFDGRGGTPEVCSPSPDSS